MRILIEYPWPRFRLYLFLQNNSTEKLHILAALELGSSDLKVSATG